MEKKPNKKLLVALTIVGGIAILGSKIWFRYDKLERLNATSTATVISSKRVARIGSSKHQSTTYNTLVVYNYNLDGKDYASEHTVLGNHADYFTPGTTVKLCYDPKNHEDSIVALKNFVCGYPY